MLKQLIDTFPRQQTHTVSENDIGALKRRKYFGAIELDISSLLHFCIAL